MRFGVAQKSRTDFSANPTIERKCLKNWWLGWDSKSAPNRLTPLRLFLAVLGDAPRSFPEFLGGWRTILIVAGPAVFALDPEGVTLR